MNNKDILKATLKLLIFILFTNCSNTTSITKPSSFPRRIEAAKKNERYFVMHSGIDVYRVSSIIVEKSNQHFTVQLTKPDSLHLANLNNPSVLNEKLLHLFMKDSTSYTLDEPHTILLSRIARIELVE